MSKSKKHFSGIYVGMALALLVAGYAVMKSSGNRSDMPSEYVECPQSAVCGTAMELPLVVSDEPEQIISHAGYTVSYNPDWNIPNWVAYELTRDELHGAEERSDHFYPDPDVNGDPVVTRDYSNSGYDRGHMAPAADMKWSEQAMKEAFYMTNMCPQNHNLNTGDWNDLEMHVRYLTGKYGNIYICSGPIVSDASKTIGSPRQIVVPDAFYKVLLRSKGNNWTAIGFMMWNRTKDGKWDLDHYAMSVDELEKITGIDFFPNLPDDTEEKAESIFSLSDWNL